MVSDSVLRRAARSLRYDLRNIAFAMRYCRHPLALAAAILRREREPRATLRDGTTIAAPEMRTLLWLLEEVFVDRAYEHGDVRVRAGDVVVDIGAHVGIFSVHAMQSGASRVIAYEPLPSNVRLLDENIARNRPVRAVDVVTVASAVGDRIGESELGLGRMSVGNVLADTVADETLPSSVRVRTTTLTALMSEHGLERIDYLKVDCEGSEGALLDATSDEVLRRIDRIALEYHDNWSRLDSSAIARRLRSVGFAVDVVPERGTPYGMMYAGR